MLAVIVYKRIIIFFWTMASEKLFVRMTVMTVEIFPGGSVLQRKMTDEIVFSDDVGRYCIQKRINDNFCFLDTDVRESDLAYDDG